MILALDTETCAWLDRPGWKAPPMVCVSLSDGESARVLHRSDPSWIGAVRAALGVGVVGHHVAFDMCVLAAAGYPLEETFEAYATNKITCTMAREKLLDIASGDLAKQRKPRGPGYALDVLVQRRLGVTLLKDEGIRLGYERLMHVPVEQWPASARDYAENDALYTHRLYEAQGGEIVDEHHQARGAFWLQLMANWGVLVDLPRLHALAARYEADFAEAGRDLVASGLARETKKGLVRNTKTAGERIVRAYERRGLDYPRTDGGKPDLSREACETSEDPTLARYAEYSALSSKVSKEIPALDHAQIHAYFDALVETGRVACSHPNLMNLPRKGGFRECLIPRPGHVYISADFRGFELATLAQCCLEIVGHSKLADALNADLDPHAMIAAEILGRSYDDVRAHAKDSIVFDARQAGKVCNFGFPGGLGAERLCHFAKQSYGVELTPDRARELKAVWFGRWPEMRDYFKRIDSAVGEHGAIEQLYSRRLRGDVGFTDACNGMFQGLAADIAKGAGFQLSRACYVGELRGDRIVLFVHDEYVVEVPEALAREHAQTVEALLVDAARPWLPGVKLGVEVTISRRYKGDYL